MQVSKSYFFKFLLICSNKSFYYKQGLIYDKINNVYIHLIANRFVSSNINYSILSQLKKKESLYFAKTILVGHYHVYHYAVSWSNICPTTV